MFPDTVVSLQVRTYMSRSTNQIVNFQASVAWDIVSEMHCRLLCIAHSGYIHVRNWMHSISHKHGWLQSILACATIQEDASFQ